MALTGAKMAAMKPIAFTARDGEKVYGFYTAPAILTEFIHCFLATDLSPAAGDHQGDEDEMIEVIPWPVADLGGLIDRVDDAKTLIGLMRLERELRAAG